MIDRTARQKEAIEKWIANKCKGSFNFCTGFGKSYTAVMAIERFFAKNPTKRVLIIVPTEVLQRQWISNLAKEGLVFNIDVLIINTAVKQQRLYDLMIIDEVHKSAATTLIEIFNKCKAPMILGLTATFERLDGRHEILNKYCPIVDTITVKEATANGWLSEYKEYKVMIEVNDISEYYQYNQEFLNHFAFFNFDFNLAMACVGGLKKGTKTIESAQSVRKRFAHNILNGNLSDSKLVENTIKEVSAHAFSWNRALKARKDFVMNHPKKVEIAELILSYRENSKAITFCSSINQAEKFKVGYVIHSRNTKKKNRLTLEEFEEIDSGVIHSSKMLNEGVDVPGLNLAIILHNTSSPTERIQKIGKRYMPIQNS